MLGTTYTGHEQLNQFNLINMNGRVYDPLVAAMVQPDNYVGDYTSSQAYNRYVYCNNNPLKHFDASGNATHHVFNSTPNYYSNYGEIEIDFQTLPKKNIMKFLRLLVLTSLLISNLCANAQTPAITSFSPASGPVGTLITISGTDLSNPTAFTVGGVAAIVVSSNGSTLVGLVMPGATSGVISITTAGGTSTATDNFTVIPTSYPSLQQGGKLVGTGSLGTAWQGQSLAVSADGNTAILGGSGDNSNVGAFWVYTRSGGIWTQQGSKLVGTGAVGAAWQGNSVAVSADGNTAIVGGYNDNSGSGSAWVFTRSGGIWTQQGSKLVGTGAADPAWQGSYVALSADGNTAIVGGVSDSNHVGAAWIYTRNGGTWSQQGSKLVGTGAVGAAQQGRSVALSADGNTAIVGGYYDNKYVGAAWVYTRSGGTWTQQGNKLVGAGAVGTAYQGSSVALSADGNTAIVGGNYDNKGAGAAWVYTRSGGTWTQQGNKLVGAGAVGVAQQGWAVALSADGNTAIVEGYNDNKYVGAAWVYTRSGGTWTQQGNKLVGTGAVGAAYQGWSVALSADGNTAIVGGFSDNSKTGAAWVFVNGNTIDIHNVAEGQETRIFPNPAENEVTIQLSNLQEHAVFYLYNSFGQVVKSVQLNGNENTLQGAGLPNGVYLYRIVNDNIQLTIGRLIFIH